MSGVPAGFELEFVALVFVGDNAFKASGVTRTVTPHSLLTDCANSSTSIGITGAKVMRHFSAGCDFDAIKRLMGVVATIGSLENETSVSVEVVFRSEAPSLLASLASRSPCLMV